MLQMRVLGWMTLVGVAACSVPDAAQRGNGVATAATERAVATHLARQEALPASAPRRLQVPGSPVTARLHPKPAVAIF